MNGKIRSMAVILLAFSAFHCAAAVASDSQSDADGLANESINSTNNAATGEAVNGQDKAEFEYPADGIWWATLGDSKVIIALNQSGQSLFGQSKFEEENTWNAALSGARSQNEVFISLAAIEGNAIVSTFIKADLHAQSMNGSFVRTDSNGMASRGEFSAILMNTDTSGYAPDNVDSLPINGDQPEVIAGNAKNETELLDAKEADQTENGNSRFKDVTRLAEGINPDILPRMAPL